jgi:hypothetical protein
MNQQVGDTGRRRSLLVIAGSGRSGTSLMAGLAGRIGFAIPQPELNPNETNPRGFGEPRWALEFHKRLMEACIISHDDGRPEAWELAKRADGMAKPRSNLLAWLTGEFELSDRVVVKDPRLGWFLNLYGAVAEEIDVDFGLITMLRHPAETVRSKQLAYGSRLEGTTRGAGWLNMMLGTEHRSRGIPRAIISYDELLTSLRPTLERAERTLGFGLVSHATDKELDEAHDLVDPSLRRTQQGWDELNLPTQLRELMESTYEAMSQLAVGAAEEKSQVSTEELDTLREAYEASYRDAEALVRSSFTAARRVERKRAAKRAQRQVRLAQQQGQVRQRAVASVRTEGVGRSLVRRAYSRAKRSARWLSSRA